MLKWLWRLIVGKPALPSCPHEWATISEGNYVSNRYIPVHGWIQSTGIQYTLRCTKCGDITTRNT